MKKSNGKLFVLILVFGVILIFILVFFQFKIEKIQEYNKKLQLEIESVEKNLLSIQNEKETLQKKLDELGSIKGGVQEHGQLRVKGTDLVDQNGELIVLRGIGSHGLAWYPEYTNYRALRTLKEYGANVFRVSMYVDQNMGYIEEPDLNEKLMYSAIENSLAADLYTIVDWHVLRDENPNKNIDKAKKFFKNVAKRYGHEKGLIYEICNEPNGETSYEDIVEYASEIIPIIRKYAPEAIILVGTPKFCTSLEEVMEKPLEFDNIMYTYHFYAGVSDYEFAIEEISRGLETGIPIFVSEWGLDSYEATKEMWHETDRFLEFLEEKNLGWINWSLSNKEEGYSIIEKDVLSISQWEKNELTDMGKYVMDYIQGE